MCKAARKRWANYYRLDNTKAFIDALSDETHIRAAELIQSLTGGNPQNQGTWVHPHIAINLAQWCSPKFAVQVSKWVFELMSTGKVELEPEPINKINPILCEGEYLGILWNCIEGLVKTIEADVKNWGFKDQESPLVPSILRNVELELDLFRRKHRREQV